MTSRLAEAEISSALARRVREGDLSRDARLQALRRLADDLCRIRVVELAPAVVAGVHALLQRHPLRAADAVHLASALFVQARAGRTEFVAYDGALGDAARAEGLGVLP
jgi:predicted nucleic acid-binding protein